MAYQQLSFVNMPALRTGLTPKRDMAVRAVALSKPRSWSLLGALDQFSLALSRNTITWATAGRL
jgi:hypothetical protein